MDTFLVPISQPQLQSLGALALLAVKILQQELDLLAEGVQALPPVRAPVLVAISDKDLVQEILDVLKHGLVMRGAGEQCGGGYEGGCGGHGEGVVVWRASEELDSHEGRWRRFYGGGGVAVGGEMVDVRRRWLRFGGGNEDVM